MTCLMLSSIDGIRPRLTCRALSTVSLSLDRAWRAESGTGMQLEANATSWMQEMLGAEINLLYLKALLNPYNFSTQVVVSHCIPRSAPGVCQFEGAFVCQSLVGATIRARSHKFASRLDRFRTTCVQLNLCLANLLIPSTMRCHLDIARLDASEY